MALPPPNLNHDDDFILTLSDHDELSYASDDSESQTIPGIKDATDDTRTARATNGKTNPTKASKKRKRGQDPTNPTVVGGRKNKKPKHASGEDSIESEDESESEEFGEDDGAMDSGFEFDVAGFG